MAVIAHRHRGQFNLHPPDNTFLTVGDRFVVSASPDAIMQIAQLTPPTREMDRYRQDDWTIKKKI